MILFLLRLSIAFFSFASALPCSSGPSIKFVRDLELLLYPKTNVLLSTRHFSGAVDLGHSVSRFTIPYAQPPVGPLRFANTQPVKGIDGYNISKTPPSCYQGLGDPRGGNAASEDCLYATYYMPTGAKAGDNLPIYVWVHGGSGISGSSTGAGLDGAAFVESQKVIVVFLQYRLGIFGWLQTGSTVDEIQGGRPGSRTVAGNQAMRDIVMALEQVKKIALIVGGDTSKTVLMGQSSGASMVRALLTTPAASGLFTRAVLVSDPADYGLSGIADNNALGEFAMKYLNCSLADIACARAASADDIVDATLQAFSNVPQSQPSISSGTPWRAMRGSYVTTSIVDDGKTSIPTIMTTVANEAGTITAQYFEASHADATELTYTDSDGQMESLGDGLSLVFDAGRGENLAGDTQVYPFSSVQDGLRETYETVVTDGIWRCSTQYMAQHLAKNGGKVWLAQWNAGTTYPSNDNADYCTADGHVCHEDDIYTVFGTAPSPTSALKQLSSAWQARLVSFANTGQPNPPNMLSWPSVRYPYNLNLLTLGGTDDNVNATASITAQQRFQACQQTWGSKVEYDWQLYES
ncbi:hypothetical protein CBS101457_000550 [Exobasidium rhododendri]|nr:hypothetical protein CBS101457_000550 [Exobasidium rhododendri]